MAQPERPMPLVMENRAPFVAERKPAPEFGELIEKFWDAPRPKESTPRTLEIFPDGNFDLVFILADFNCRLLFIGPYTKDTYIQLSDSHEYFSVRFRPGLMPRIADIKPAELVDNMIDLPGILGIETDLLGERLCASPDYRKVFEGIVYVLRTGCQWKALPKEVYGSPSSIHAYFRQWERAGVFLAIWRAGLAEYDEMEGISWLWQILTSP